MCSGVEEHAPNKYLPPAALSFFVVGHYALRAALFLKGCLWHVWPDYQPDSIRNRQEITALTHGRRFKQHTSSYILARDKCILYKHRAHMKHGFSFEAWEAHLSHTGHDAVRAVKFRTPSRQATTYCATHSQDQPSKSGSQLGSLIHRSV